MESGIKYKIFNILYMKIPTLNEIKQNQRLQYGTYLKKCYPEFFDFLLSEYI